MRFEFSRVLRGRFSRVLGAGEWRWLSACLLFGFGVRLVPELLAWGLPVGFDTVYYAFAVKAGVVWAHWTAFFTSSWLFYALVVPVYAAFRVDPFLLLKFVAPLLYGLNVAGVYWFARGLLGWDRRVCVAAAVFFALQLAALRVSWDLLRNLLGLGLLLFSFAFVERVGSRWGFAVFSVLGVLAVFAHEYAAVTFVAVVAALVVWRLVRGCGGALRLFLAGFPALAVFAVGMYLRFFPVRYAVASRVVGSGDVVLARAGGLFFMVDYLRVRTGVDAYAGYWSLASSVLVLFAVLYGVYFFLVVKGFFRNGVLTVWTGLLLVGAFGCLVVPFFALDYWHRWMFMLVYPFTFYAVNGVCRSGAALAGSALRWLFSGGAAASAMVLASFALGVAYLATPALMVYAGTSVPSVTGTYRFFSTSPCVPYEDVAGVEASMRWLNMHEDASSCVLLQHAFEFWGLYCLDSSWRIVAFEVDPSAAVAAARAHGYARAYFVWWNVPLGWYGVSVPAGFVRLEDFGRISIYACTL